MRLVDPYIDLQLRKHSDSLIKLLLRVFDVLESRDVIALTPVCRHFHCLALRLIHNRLQIAAGLASHTLFLECHHPAARTPGGKLSCQPQTTRALTDLLSGVHDENNYIGQVKQVFDMYTPFTPQRRPPETTIRWSVPGDIPGSRTHPSSNPQVVYDLNEPVTYTITVDSQEVFSQLSCLAYLGRSEYAQGMMFSIQQVSEGHIRIWRNWLSDQCERKTWNDGEPIAIYHEAPTSPMTSTASRPDGGVSYIPPTKDPSVLWVDSRDENVGIKFRVRERVWRRAAPVAFSSDVEAPVTYKVELEGES